MGFVYCMAPCVNCGKPFSFHPNLVPSLRIKGVRQPVCRACIERANPLRKANGLPEIEIQPGAYEPAEENEVNYNS